MSPTDYNNKVSSFSYPHMYFVFPKSHLIFLKIQNMTVILSSIKTTPENHFLKKDKFERKNWKTKINININTNKSHMIITSRKQRGGRRKWSRDESWDFDWRSH